MSPLLFRDVKVSLTDLPLSGLLSIAVQGAFTIGLHRDPSRSKRFSFLESEDRRSVFWNLFSQCMTSTWVRLGRPLVCLESAEPSDSSQIFGRSWPQFDLSLIDCGMPLDCHDEELHQDERATRAAVSRRASRLERERSALDDADETDMTILIVSPFPLLGWTCFTDALLKVQGKGGVAHQEIRSLTIDPVDEAALTLSLGRPRIRHQASQALRHPRSSPPA